MDDNHKPTPSSPLHLSPFEGYPSPPDRLEDNTTLFHGFTPNFEKFQKNISARGSGKGDTVLFVSFDIMFMKAGLVHVYVGHAQVYMSSAQSAQ
eukprot:1334707-Amorphochlora_amoeboformis.AAC.1